MLGFPDDVYSATKCYATHGVMGHVDPKQPPTKRKPFSTIMKHDFVQQVELILPEELYEIISKTVLTVLPIPTYSRVILPLGALLEGEFFNEFIKRGNIAMLSEGKLGVDNVYSLKEGILTLHLDKESHDRSGLLFGKPEGVKGKRGTKPRWIVKIDLRSPSMLHGKKGFDRIVYAFKNVLNVAVTWLFINLEEKALDPEPLDAHFPVRKDAKYQAAQSIPVRLPLLNPPTNLPLQGEDFEEYAVELHEWLSMILLDSPRIRPNASIDPFLSRYEPPGSPSEICKVVKLKWRGFISPFWVRDVFVRMLQAAPRDPWFAMCVHGFEGGLLEEGDTSTMLKLPRTPIEYVLWDIRSSMD